MFGLQVFQEPFWDPGSLECSCLCRVHQPQISGVVDNDSCDFFFFLITPFAVVSAAAGARLGEIAQGVHECGRLVGPSDDYGLAARSTPGVHPCLWPCWALSKDVLGECVECRW